MAYVSKTVSSKEAAAILGVSIHTVHRMIDAGTLTQLPNVKHRRVTKHSIEQALGHPLDEPAVA